MEIKPGWKTTEFWISIGTNLVSLLVALGIISMQDGALVQSAVVSGITAVFALISAAVVVWKYVQSRSETKVAIAEANAMIQTAQLDAKTLGDVELPKTLQI